MLYVCVHVSIFIYCIVFSLEVYIFYFKYDNGCIISPWGFGLTVNVCTVKALLAIGYWFKSPMGSYLPKKKRKKMDVLFSISYKKIN